MKYRTRTYRLFFCLLFGLMLMGSINAVAQSSYSHRKKVTIKGSKIVGSFQDFTALISITDSDLAAHGQSPNGYDIYFTSDPNDNKRNNPLDEQIESYNPSTGKLKVWVRLQNLQSGQDKEIYMFYGKSNVSNNPSAKSVWDNSNYTSVYHLSNFSDATSTGNNGINKGSINVSGKIGNARWFDGSNDYIELNQNIAQVLKGNGTVSAWIKTTQTGSDTPWSAPGLIGVEENGGGNDIFYGFLDGSGRMSAVAGNGSVSKSSNALNDNQWHHVVFTRNASSGQIVTYVDGIIRGNVSSETGNKTTTFNSIGRIENTGKYYNGRIDEFRVSNQVIPQNQIKTAYNNQKDPPNFYTLGAQQPVQNTDVEVAKTVGMPNPEELETITYTLTAINNGNNSVSGVQLEDKLPQGLDFVSATPSQGSYNNSTGVWNIGSIPVNGSETLTIEAEVEFGQQGNTITNTASLSAIDQADDNPSNDSDSAPINVQYSGGNGPPPSGCQGLPTLQFNNGSLVSGSRRQVGAVYRYNNVLQDVDATVTITNKTNVTLNNVDNDAANANAFRPAINVGFGRGYVDFKIDFFENGTSTPKKIDRFILSGTNVNGDEGSWGRRYELVGFSSSASYTLATSSNLQENNSDPLFDIFESTADNIHQGNPLNYPDGIVSLNYKSTSSFQIRAGMVDNIYTNVGSQLDFDFNPCIPNAFPRNPMPSANNADVAITKTVDNSNLGEGNNVTYTLSVQNNGPEDATEVLIKDPLPSDLSYISSSTSTGSYDDTNGEWNIGDIANGNAKTLEITAKINQGAAGKTINNIARVEALNQTDPNVSNQQDNAEVTVKSGSDISGTVYSDANHNGTQDSGEGGITGVTIILHDIDDESCQSVQTDGSGNYQFDNISNGDYELIEAAEESVPTPSSCPAAEADPLGYVSTTPNTQPIAVNNNSVTLNFGDFKGSKAAGNVFNDNGAGSGTANDVVQNGGESGISGITVKANDGSGNTILQTTTGGDGSYQFYLADNDFPDNSTVVIKEVGNSTLLSVGADVSSTSGGSYDRQSDEITFTNSSGTKYSSVSFADVNKSLLITDGQQTLTPGSGSTFSHKFKSKTEGSVSFNIQSSNSPSGLNFSPVLYEDNNCNQEIDNGESPITNSLSVATGQAVCLLVKVNVPQGAVNGNTGNITLKATFSLSNTSSPTIQQNPSRTDVINVSDTNGGLKLSKSVDKNQALPGETLEYTVTYINNGNQPINTLEVTDNVPAYTTYSSSDCSTDMAGSLSGCSTTLPSNNGGVIKWTFSGSLSSGDSGEITYKVQIQN